MSKMKELTSDFLKLSVSHLTALTDASGRLKMRKLTPTATLRLIFRFLSASVLTIFINLTSGKAMRGSGIQYARTSI